MDPRELFEVRRENLYRMHTGIPGWAKAEQLEMSYPLTEIRRLDDSILMSGKKHAGKPMRLISTLSALLYSLSGCLHK